MVSEPEALLVIKKCKSSKRIERIRLVTSQAVGRKQDVKRRLRKINGKYEFQYSSSSLIKF